MTIIGGDFVAAKILTAALHKTMKEKNVYYGT